MAISICVGLICLRLVIGLAAAGTLPATYDGHSRGVAKKGRKSYKAWRATKIFTANVYEPSGTTTSQPILE